MMNRNKYLKFAQDTLKDWFPDHNITLDASQQTAKFEIQYADAKVMGAFVKHLTGKINFTTVDEKRVTVTEDDFEKASSQDPFGSSLSFSAREFLTKLNQAQQSAGAGAGPGVVSKIGLHSSGATSSGDASGNVKAPSAPLMEDVDDESNIQAPGGPSTRRT